MPSLASPGPHTRGFLFADLRGYTRFTDQHGDDAARELIRRYRELVRAEIRARDGAEIRTEGDSFYVVFDSVADAILAGLAIATAASDAPVGDPATSPISVGIGIHAGEARDGEEGIVSSAVNIAARVCSIAKPGEVLVTDTVRSLTRSSVAVGFSPRGRRRLKGIAEPVAVFAVTSRSPTDRTNRARPLGAWASVGGVIATALAVIVVLSVRGAQPTDGDSPRASPGAAGETSPEGTPDLGRFNDLGEFPNAAERELLDRLPSLVESSCERADLADRPAFHFLSEFPGPPVPLQVRAGLSCLTQTVRVHYWHGAGGPSPLALVTDLFFDTARRLSITEGSCSEASRVQETWDAGLHSGRVLCYVSADASAVMHWTFDDLNVYAVASRRDGDTRALYAWWRETGRSLGR